MLTGWSVSSPSLPGRGSHRLREHVSAQEPNQRKKSACDPGPGASLTAEGLQDAGSLLAFLVEGRGPVCLSSVARRDWRGGCTARSFARRTRPAKDLIQRHRYERRSRFRCRGVCVRGAGPGLVPRREQCRDALHDDGARSRQRPRFPGRPLAVGGDTVLARKLQSLNATVGLLRVGGSPDRNRYPAQQSEGAEQIGLGVVASLRRRGFQPARQSGPARMPSIRQTTRLP